VLLGGKRRGIRRDSRRCQPLGPAAGVRGGATAARRKGAGAGAGDPPPGCPGAAPSD